MSEDVLGLLRERARAAERLSSDIESLRHFLAAVDGADAGSLELALQVSREYKAVSVVAVPPKAVSGVLKFVTIAVRERLAQAECELEGMRP